MSNIAKPTKPYTVRKKWKDEGFFTKCYYVIEYEELEVASSSSASLLFTTCDLMNAAYSVGWYDSIVPNTPHIVGEVNRQLSNIEGSSKNHSKP